VVDTALPTRGAADGAWKEAKLETGLQIMVPLFIASGDTIRVDTAEKKYLAKETSRGYARLLRGAAALGRCQRVCPAWCINFNGNRLTVLFQLRANAVTDSAMTWRKSASISILSSKAERLDKLDSGIPSERLEQEAHMFA
jgi:hypothetical protein